ncbi:MAG: dipeptide epimerase [Planctomycetes bacterium]|nr:dipeptide epimerase [Planctomycetota bacterium]
MTGRHSTTRATLEFAPLELSLRHPWTTARNTSNVKKNGLLTIAADGVIGYGEAAPNVRYGQNYDLSAQAFTRIRAAVNGLAPMEHLEWIARAEEVAGANMETVAALDMALWDWKGKICNKSVSELLGVPRAIEKMPPTSYSIGIDVPELLKRKVREAEAFSVLKIKLGAGRDAEHIAAVREATSKRLRVDINEGWKSVSETVDKIHWLAEQGVELLEQPLPAIDRHGAQAIYEQSVLPVIADESLLRIRDLGACAGAFHGVNIKLSKCGGIARALEMAAAARALGLKLMIGCMIESSVGIAAAAAIGPLFDWVDLDGNLLIDADPFAGLTLDGGRWRLPHAPGLGVAPVRKETICL